MNDVLLVVLGAALGSALTLAGKALFDPILERRSRRTVRREQWLEDAVRHAEDVQAHIAAVRNEVSAKLGYDSEAIASEIAKSLTSDYAPDPFKTAASHIGSSELVKFADNAAEAWFALGFARSDLEHGVPPAEPRHEPEYAVQWYSTQVRNFEHEARRLLAGAA